MKKVYAISTSLQSPTTFGDIFVGTLNAFSDRINHQVSSPEEMQSIATKIFGDVYVTEVVADTDTLDLAGEEGIDVTEDQSYQKFLGLFLDATIDFDSIIQQEIDDFNRTDENGNTISLELLKNEQTLYQMICMSIQRDIDISKMMVKH
ncbi:MAG: hypothetical protein QXN55_00425 [Candidatus Nitrosotenuis sp.]